ncbi:hypothetical protein RG271_02625 [Bifidobacterium adolescentis]|uniref:hypothetical protein n=1 Tax=Bifidobacterium adolescentis TaxID=1680 RepID=UPI00406321D1
MFAEECGANGDMAREGRVPMARLYVQGVPAVRDLDVLVWNPDEGAPVFGDNPTLVVDRPPKGPDHIGSLHLGMGGHGAVMFVEHGRVRFAIPGIDVDGRFALFDDDRRSLARMDWECTRAAYAYVEGLEAKEVRPGPKPAPARSRPWPTGSSSSSAASRNASTCPKARPNRSAAGPRSAWCSLGARRMTAPGRQSTR